MPRSLVDVGAAEAGEGPGEEARKKEKQVTVYVLVKAALRCLPTGLSLGGNTVAKGGWIRRKRRTERSTAVERKRVREGKRPGSVVRKGTFRMAWPGEAALSSDVQGMAHSVL